jgi:lipid II:glycine glycyltransferase (peptidoglycan interpeptide bridge formation enzyme)
VLVAHFAREMVYLYGGSEARHRERQPSSALHFHVIREALAAGCDRYDLWGVPPSADPGHAWHGLRQFKLALGGVERGTAGAFEQVRRPVAARAVAAANAARRTARRARRLGGARGRSGSAVQSRPTMDPSVDS